ncbi:MAG: glycoside hydrolase family 3 C-terminal domain-containing protein [Eubacteriales bacterium]|nr:glycoside hydrolase family 3 C-terminal domain-containing protein [Eubacteriales bacterium]
MKQYEQQVKKLVSQMTLEEKASLCSGADFWNTKAIPRLQLSSVMVSDGPHGLRKQSGPADHLGLNDSMEAVCFPAGSAMASSFDRTLIRHIGQLLGEEAKSEHIHTLLGPAINIKRSPLCGRNFEYLSEDPYLAGEMASSYVEGVQSQDVGVSVKHYAANNQEYRRMSTDSTVDERTLREIYLKAFEITVRNSRPWTIMGAYNRLNGTYCCENEWLLTTVLREEWGFDGIVMSDWGAVNNRVRALQAGLNLEMPASDGLTDQLIVDAVKDGSLDITVLDNAVSDLVNWVLKGQPETSFSGEYDKALHHEESRKAAAQCAVLLKNEANILPLSKRNTVAFIGPFAKVPRFQGGGSSHIHASRLIGAVEAAKTLPVIYAAGVEADGETRSEALLSEAISAAKQATAAVLFAGLPESFESEGYDRTHLELPACQNELIEAVAAVQPNTIIVLHNGSPVAMPWLDHVAAVLEMYLGGQAVGAAAVDLLYGDANPCGKLAETFPLRIEDTPSYLNFPGDGQTVRYGEGVFVGYRWYDSRHMKVLFPFGHGLSYTTFAFDQLSLSSETLTDGEQLTVRISIKNTGLLAGSEVVQLYIAPPEKQLDYRPAQELKGFEKTALQPGAEKTVTFVLDTRAFAYYRSSNSCWYAPSGCYELRIGNSSRNILCRASVTLKTKPPRLIYSESLTMGDLLEHGMMNAFGALLQDNALFNANTSTPATDENTALTPEMMEAMLGGLPLHAIARNKTREEIQKILDLG